MLRLEVPSSEAVMARLLGLAPLGVHEVGDRLVMHAPELPREAEMAAALGVEEVTLSEVADVAAERLAVIARPPAVDGRVCVRLEWMAPAPDVVDIVLGDGTGFGSGAHPTTRDCLSLLLAQAPGGAFADLGCGAGVLAIAAARLGYAPVVAVDVEARAVAGTRANAAANGVEIEAIPADLLREGPPPARVAAANVSAAVHLAVAAAWRQPPEVLIVSGIRGDEQDAVAAAYAARGLALAQARAAGDWVTLLLERDPRAADRMSAVRAPGTPHRHPIADTARTAAPVPPPAGERTVELGARAALFDLPGGTAFDAWALDDSLRWALRGPAGTTMEVLREERLERDDAHASGRPPSTVHIDLLVRPPAGAFRATMHLTVTSREPGLVTLAASAAVRS